MGLVDTVADPYAESYAAASVADEQKHLLAYAPLVKRIVRQLNSPTWQPLTAAANT